MSQRPPARVTDEYLVPEEVSTALISAPTTGFPEASVTVPPRAEEVVPCAPSCSGSANKAARIKNNSEVKVRFFMTEALLVGIRGADREKKIELDENFLNATGWGGVARFGASQRNDG
jgi:hypothetical protein